MSSVTMESTSTAAPATPQHTTVSPNDKDEGLYLLWTHQLLRERGFKPSSCRESSDPLEYSSTVDGQDEYDDDDDDCDSRSTDSSLTQDSLLLQHPSGFSDAHDQLFMAPSASSSFYPQQAMSLPSSIHHASPHSGPSQSGSSSSIWSSIKACFAC
ncbi:hypothetical protein BCR43DRAFT_492220 [Syncephalastrum racemosum]|uniref:Uncharacterized protein n=1 Tax=Syncephalastrum racemosum TaxID=13706 RepID=A0A1X2HDE0_SYNRA|nr:hypothetical protein BCR43DRAFT_492220 [Syncephalastrum racemosum]